MRISGIIHQQICQLKWHLLACLGLIMALPIEEAIVDLRAGDGYVGSGMTSLVVVFGPLLSGLIACANVQGDLNEKRYIFWRSKPANVKLLITLKFFIGLIGSLLIIACPLVFAILCSIIWEGEGIGSYVPLPILIAIMTYSLCFACNVLVRKTARAWLLGILLAGFFLVLPFLLPLDYRDYRDILSDFTLQTVGPTLVIILIASAAAFVFSLYAAQHDWHLRTNLKSLLWAGSGLVFILTMLFSSQVANIKLLDEKETNSSYGPFQPRMDWIESRVTLRGRNYVDIVNNNISLSDICDVPTYGAANIPRIGFFCSRMYPSRMQGSLFKKAGEDVYFLTIHAYYQRKLNTNLHWKNFYKKVYLRSYRLGGDSRIPVCELDLSNFLTDETNFMRVEMRLINNTLVAFINDSYVVVDATNPDELIQTEKKANVLKTPLPYFHDRLKEFTLPLIPIDGLSIEERIKLSIEWNYHYRHFHNSIYDSSIVEVHEGKIAFVLVSEKDIARYDVVRWDREKIYCKFGAARPFTIIEGMIRWPSPKRVFVKNGNLYCYDDSQLMVFDIRSKHKIRKLGHFTRMDGGFEDIEVLDNGNILLAVGLPHGEKSHLYLLENPG